MATYLISEQTLKDTTVLNENVDPKLIAPAILEAQDIEIQAILGSTLYNKVLSLIPSGVISTAPYANYKTLLDSYIQPSLKYYVLSELIFPMTFKLMNKSVASRSSEFSSSISSDEIGMNQEFYKNKAEYYATRMINYLRDNQSLFPEYLQLSSTGFSTIYPRGTAYTNGMFLYDEAYFCMIRDNHVYKYGNNT